MATLRREDGIATEVFSAVCALRMRVSISAIGSVMLIGSLLPACLGQAGNFAAHRNVAQLVAAQAEFAVRAARTPGQLASVAQPRRAGIARQLLQLVARRHALV